MLKSTMTFSVISEHGNNGFREVVYIDEEVVQGLTPEGHQITQEVVQM